MPAIQILSRDKAKIRHYIGRHWTGASVRCHLRFTATPSLPAIATQKVVCSQRARRSSRRTIANTRSVETKEPFVGDLHWQ